MRTEVLLAAALLVVTRVPAWATCPGPECFGGGGPPVADCIVTWSGIAAAATSCVDGTPCDLDGRADGRCTFSVAACLGAAPSCNVAGTPRILVLPAKLPASKTLRAAIAALAPGQCTPPGLAVPVRRGAGLARMRPGVARVKVVATAGSAKDADVLRLTCRPAAPSLQDAVQPMLTRRCATSGCHGETFPAAELVLSPGVAHGALVGAPSEEGGKLLLVKPGSIARSFLARKILGVGLSPANGSRMPPGCPGVPPFGGCPTDAELYTILAWIQAGAPPN